MALLFSISPLPHLSETIDWRRIYSAKAGPQPGCEKRRESEIENIFKFLEPTVLSWNLIQISTMRKDLSILQIISYEIKEKINYFRRWLFKRTIKKIEKVIKKSFVFLLNMNLNII